MKNIKRKLVLVTTSVILTLSISIGATALRNTKTYVRFYTRPSTEKKIYTEVTKYKGEFIPLVQLPEVIIKDTAIQKKK